MRMTVAEFGIAGFPERLIQALAVQTGDLRNLSHAARACDEAEGVAREIRVTGLERRRDTSDPSWFCASKVSASV